MITKEKIGLLFVFLGSLALSIVSFPATDAQRLGTLADNIVSGRGFNLAGQPETIFSPGQALLLLPLKALGIPSDIAVAILSALGLTALVAVVYLIVQRYWDRLTAWIAAGFLAVNGYMLTAVADGAGEIVFLPLLLTSFYWLFTKRFHPAAAGAVGGLAYLVKPEAVVFMAVVFPLALMLNRKKVRSQIKRFAWYLAPVIAVMGAYAGFIYNATGTVALSGKSVVIDTDRWVEDRQFRRDEKFYQLNPDLSVGVNPEYPSDVPISKRDHLDANLVALRLMLADILSPIYLVLAVLLIGAAFSRDIRKALAVVTVVTLPVLGTLIFHIEHRYLLTVLIGAIILLAVISTTWLRDRRWPYRLVSYSGLATLVAMTYFAIPPLDDQLYRSEVNERITRGYLNKDFQDKLLISRKPNLSLVWGADYSPVPWSNSVALENAFLEKMKAKGAYVVLDEWTFRSTPMDRRLRERYRIADNEKAVIDLQANRVILRTQLQNKEIKRSNTKRYTTYDARIREAQGLRK